MASRGEYEEACVPGDGMEEFYVQAVPVKDLVRITKK